MYLSIYWNTNFGWLFRKRSFILSQCYWSITQSFHVLLDSSTKVGTNIRKWEKIVRRINSIVTDIVSKSNRSYRILRKVHEPEKTYGYLISKDTRCWIDHGVIMKSMWILFEIIMLSVKNFPRCSYGLNLVKSWIPNYIDNDFLKSRFVRLGVRICRYIDIIEVKRLQVYSFTQ